MKNIKDVQTAWHGEKIDLKRCLEFLAQHPPKIGYQTTSARRRWNHDMVEEGVHIVPTLRNRVVIFKHETTYLKGVTNKKNN